MTNGGLWQTVRYLKFPESAMEAVKQTHQDITEGMERYPRKVPTKKLLKLLITVFTFSSHLSIFSGEMCLSNIHIQTDEPA